MKKQINPTIKAHLVRSACYVLLLIAVCVIPFALAQQKTPKKTFGRPKLAAKHIAANPSSVAPGTHAPGSMVTKATSLAPASSQIRRSQATSKAKTSLVGKGSAARHA